MKIGIITIFKTNNYGAELQAYALQKKLELMGHQSELIDYPFYKHKSHVKCQQSKPLFNIGLTNRLKEILYPFVQAYHDYPIRDKVKLKQAKMDEFQQKFAVLSKVCYQRMMDLYSADLPYDVFMVGSDQVWNPRMNSSLDPYFLTFAPPNKPRVSYASSFGVSVLPEHTKKIYAERLSAFNALSVREEQGVRIVHNLLGHAPEHVLDPTLLLDENDWTQVAVPVYKAVPYVLIYELMPCGALSEVAEHVASQIKNAQVVRIRGGAGIKKKPRVVENDDAGPSEFVGLFLGASAVVTNSFHGTAFAINFRKPVYPVIPVRMHNASRIESLLELLGLKNRILHEASKMDVDLGEIDYCAVMGRLECERKKSVNYLELACS
jgi:hypothetical protein